MESHWFAPSDLSSELALVSLTKSFVPFFVFDIEASTDYVCDIPLDNTSESSGALSMLRRLTSGSVRHYKTVGGKRSSRHSNLLQAATPSLNMAHISALANSTLLLLFI